MSREETSAPGDAELIAQAQNGRVEAFGELYARYSDQLFRYIRLRVDRAADAEDLCETTFLRSFEALGRYKERGHPFSAYLYRVARNLLVDHYRSQGQQLQIDEVHDPALETPDPSEDVSRHEQYQQIARALGRLPEDYQEVIRLRVVLELPTPTVAAWMDRSPGAVRVLLHRALNALREGFEHEEG